MSSIHKNFSRRFVKYLRRFGVELVPGNGHAKMVKNGVTMGSISTTDRGEHVYLGAVKQLVERGAIPRSALKRKLS